MNKTRKRSFTALLFALVAMFVLVLSLGIFCACDGNASMEEDGANDSASGIWYYGDKEPAQTLGKAGDYYLNTKTLASYVKEGKTWRIAAEGEVCNWHYGSGAPDESTAGEVNDFYLDSATGGLYQKAEEGWGDPILTIQGEKGRDGVMWFTGTGAPENIAGAAENDFYLDTEDGKFDIYQYHKDGDDLTWGDPLGTLKGEQGQAAKEPVRFFNGNGAPGLDNPETKDPKEGDLYLGTFDGLDRKGAGTRLYLYHNNNWDVLMENMHDTQVDIHSKAQLVSLAENVQGGEDYAGMEVHLKTGIDFNEVKPALGRRAVATIAADGWLPIGTKDHPFRGTFDGEGNTITNFKTTVSADATEVGFFGHVDGATIRNLRFVDVVVDATEVESPKDMVGAVVVGQAQGNVTVKDVTVTGATVETAEGTAEEDAPAVGGLVGKLESSDPAKETTLKVEGSSFEGSGTADLVADKGTADVDITDSTLTDSTTNETVNWNDRGEHTYDVSSLEEITDLLKGAKADDKLCVVLENNLDLTQTTLTIGDSVKASLTIDVAGHELTFNSETENAKLVVSGGAQLTVTDQKGTGVVHMGRVENQPVISVSGEGSALNLENVKVEVNNTYDCKNTYASYNIAPAIVAENGGTVNIGGGSNITVEGPKETNDPENYRGTNYKEPQLAAVSGKGSVINIDDENTVINLTHATGIYAEKEGTINFKNGTLNMTGGGCCVGLGLGTGAGNILFSGGTINIEGEITGNHLTGKGLENVAIAIGSTQEECDGAEVIVSGGIINLAPTFGIAIAVSGWNGFGDDSYAYVGGNVTINLKATETGKAYVAAGVSEGNGGFVMYFYAGTTINGEDQEKNFRAPGFLEDIAGGLSGMRIGFRLNQPFPYAE